MNSPEITKELPKEKKKTGWHKYGISYGKKLKPQVASIQARAK